MNRRGFMASILALGAAPAIVRAQSLMRVSGIVVPTLAETATYGNTLVTPAVIAREALRMLEQNLAFASRVNDDYAEFFDGYGTVTVRRSGCGVMDRLAW